MSQTNPILLPMAISAAFGGAFLMNEWTHGGMSEAVGMGHRHALDAGGYHCAAHDDPSMGEEHLRHMHGSASVPHGSCRGGAGMHGMGGQAMGGGA